MRTTVYVQYPMTVEALDIIPSKAYSGEFVVVSHGREISKQRDERGVWWDHGYIGCGFKSVEAAKSWIAKVYGPLVPAPEPSIAI